MGDTAGRCLLVHRGFVVLGDIVFQRSEADGVPVAMIPLGDRSAALPLRALQRELGIEDDSDDGRMLALVVEALDYVVSLQLGDRLPAEVLSGEASWSPEPAHLEASRTWLRACVLRWTASVRRPGDYATALEALVPLIGVADGAAAMEAIEALAHELSFIEASREILLLRVRRLGTRLERLRLDSAPGQQRDELGQARRLAATALERIAARFADVEAQTADIVIALRRVAALRAYIRSNRDWLHRSRLAWDPVLAGWDREPTLKAAARRALIHLTYRFLAQRFMSAQEWRTAVSRRAPLKAEAVYEW
jgi:hypothetical protein